MYLHVPTKMGRCSKRMVTLVALMRPFTSVGHQVLFHITCGVRGKKTPTAFIGFHLIGVYLHVAFKVCFSTRGKTALAAFMWFFSGVNQCMSFHMIQITTAKITNVAFMWFFSLMLYFDVLFQARCKSKFRRTLFAFIRLLIDAMLTHMHPKMCRIVGSIITVSAFVSFFTTTMYRHVPL